MVECRVLGRGRSLVSTGRSPLREAKSLEWCGPHERPVIALLPGSRLGEIERHLAKMLEATKGFDADIVIPAANQKVRAAIERICGAVRDGTRPLPSGESGLRIVDGMAREVLSRATCAVVASGTATLEAALARCPTVLVYDIGRLTGFIARRLIKGIHYVGLANIVWEKCAGKGKPPMPELLQEAFTPAAVRNYLERWLNDPAAREETIARLDAAMGLLLSDGSAIDRICDIICAKFSNNQPPQGENKK